VLPEESYFGTSIVQLGDLDGDGHRELGVLAPYGHFYGRLFVLFLALPSASGISASSDRGTTG
jgi:hypothetical protein